MTNKIAVIRVRGGPNKAPNVSRTLHLLKLEKRNYCSVLEDSKAARGMLDEVKDFVTWGDINEETLKALVQKRGVPSSGKKFLESEGKKVRKVFSLNSPRRGFGRKGIKRPFSSGGALGERKDKINDLIIRMI